MHTEPWAKKFHVRRPLILSPYLRFGRDKRRRKNQKKMENFGSRNTHTHTLAEKKWKCNHQFIVTRSAWTKKKKIFTRAMVHTCGSSESQTEKCTRIIRAKNKNGKNNSHSCRQNSILYTHCRGECETHIKWIKVTPLALPSHCVRACMFALEWCVLCGSDYKPADLIFHAHRRQAHNTNTQQNISLSFFPRTN